MTEVVHAARLAAARTGDERAFEDLVEQHRRELLLHCYRILGSAQDAEDAVQETMLRAWQRLDTYQGRGPLRAWLYRIASHASFDALDHERRRTLPMHAQPPADPELPFAPPVTDPLWLEPLPDEMLADAAESPEARYTARESVTLAFLTALQALPPRQRVVLLMRDVLAWRAREVAGLLDLSLPAVNSALQRARATLAHIYRPEPLAPRDPQETDPATHALLERYVQAWESADVPALISLFREEAEFAMPPSPSWYAGRTPIEAFFRANLFAGEARGRWRLRGTRANGQPAMGLYERGEARGAYRAQALQVLIVAEAQLARVVSFFNPRHFSRFGLALEIGI